MAASPPDESVLRFGSLALDRRRRLVSVNGNALHLTSAEYALLEVLLTHPGLAMSSRQLLSAMWNREWQGDTQPLQVHVSRLRRKLGAAGGDPKAIQTVHGFGYRFVPDGDGEVVELLLDHDFILRRIRPHRSFLGWDPDDVIDTFFSPLGLDEATLRSLTLLLLSQGRTIEEAELPMQTADGGTHLVHLATEILTDGSGAFSGLLSRLRLS